MPESILRESPLARFGLAARATFDELREDVTPEPGETWGSKVSRSSRAIRNAFVRRSEHDREVK